MTDNVLQLWPQILSVVGGTLVFLTAGFAFAFKYRATAAKAGERGQRPEGAQKEAEKVSPDGFIDSFAGVISEAGGGLPFMAVIIMGATVVAYFVYLFLYWQGR